MTRGRMIALILAVIVLLPVAAAAAFVLTFNPNRFAPQIIAAVQRATGRTLTFGGPLELQLSLTPTIEAQNVTLSNPPGFKSTNLLTICKIDAQFRLLPLLSHRLDILNLVLTRPTIALEKNAAGAADWSLTPSPGTQGGPPPAPAPGHAYQVALEAVRLQNGMVRFQGPGNAAPLSLALTQLTGTATALDAPLRLQADAAFANTDVTLSGTVGPISRFSGVGGGPWPVDVTLGTAGASLHVAGSVAAPRQGSGYDVILNATIPALEAFNAFLPPGMPALPPIHAITARVRIVDQNAAIPAIDNLSIKTGASDLSAYRPGLMLASADIEMPSLDQTLTLNATGSIDTAPLTLSGTIGAVQALFDPAWLPATMPPQGGVTLNLAASDGAAKVSIKGGIATPEKLAGVALALNATVPRLTSLMPLAAVNLPNWNNIAVQASLTDPGGMGLRKAAGLDSLAVSMDHATFGGVISLYFGAAPRLQAALAAQNLDIDALAAGWPAPAAQPAPAPAPQTPIAPAGPAAPKLLLPDLPLPITLLKMASADAQLSTTTLVFDKSVYTGLQAHAVLANGVLTINPLTGELPGGSVAATLTLNAGKTPAAATVTLEAPALALSPVLHTLGLPDTAQGTIQARANLSATGDSLNALAGTLNGQFGLAAVNGLIDGAVLDDLLGRTFGTLGVQANLASAGGPVTLRCFALRVDASNGVGTVRALTLDSNRLVVQGGGIMNLQPETLDLVVRPEFRIGGNTAGVPVAITGSFARPVSALASLDELHMAAANAPGLAGPGGNGGSLLGQVAAAIGLGPSGDICPSALSLGRLGATGPAAPPQSPAQAAVPNGTPNVTPGGPKSLLNALFGH